jgi:hypothetical protein
MYGAFLNNTRKLHIYSKAPLANESFTFLT